MPKYIFVGSKAERAPYIFSALGQPVELPQSEVAALVDAGIHLIPEADFILTLKSESPVTAAWLAFDKFKESLKRPATPEEETDTNG